MINDLISKSALLEELRKGVIITDDLYGMGIMAGNDHAIKKIEAAPAVDAVPVVRCKDCKYAYIGDCRDYEDMAYCQKIEEGASILMPMDGFCNYGERRADNVL